MSTSSLIYIVMPQEAFPPLPGLTVPTQFSQGPWGGGHLPTTLTLEGQDHAQFLPHKDLSTSLEALYLGHVSQYVCKTEEENV